MLIRIIEGAIGSGKSDLLQSLAAESLTNGRRTLLIVPEPLSYTAERSIAIAFGGSGLNGIEVTTLSKLARKSLPRQKRISGPGKEMLTMRCVLESKLAGNGIFESVYDLPGFSANVSGLISEFKRYGVTPEMLTADCEPPLSDKLLFLKEVYALYNDYLPSGYADGDDDFVRLGAAAENSELFKDCDLYFDEFPYYTEAQINLISSFVKAAASVTLTVTIPDENRFGGVYRCSEESHERLCGLSEKTGAELVRMHADGEGRHIKSPEILHLLTHWDDLDPDTAEYPDLPGDIRVLSCDDRHSELSIIAAEIKRLVRTENRRYRDFGVILADGSSHMAEAVFGDFDIPTFTDEKIILSDHPILAPLTSVFEIIGGDYRYNKVFAYLRSGFIFTKNDSGEVCRLDSDGIDLMEAYVLKNGINSKSAWLSEESWSARNEGVFDSAMGLETSENTDGDIELINSVRKSFVEPISALHERISGKRRGIELLQAVFEYLCDIHLREGIELEISELEAADKRDEALRLSQIWNKLLELLEQLSAVIGDGFISRENFVNMLMAGLSSTTVSIIPSGSDRVSVGTIEGSLPCETPILFVTGAVYGTIPVIPQGTSLLSEDERKFLKGCQIQTAPLLEDIRVDLDYKVVRALTAASERLYISYPNQNSEGEALTPSGILSDFYRLFPKLKAEAGTLTDEGRLSSYKRARSSTIAQLSLNPNDLRWQSVCKYFDKTDPINRNFNDSRLSAAKITPENALLLYGRDRSYSVSALQLYNTCPYSYFMQYGMRIKPMEEYSIRSTDTGSLIHWAICEFCTRVENGANTYDTVKAAWNSLTKEQVDRLLTEIIGEITERTLGDNSDKNTGKIAFTLRHCEKAIRNAVEIIVASLTAGEYIACAYEQPFNCEVEGVKLRGIIDRLDIMRDIENKLCRLRVVDYKSGRKEFSVSGIANKLDLQLVTYAIAAESLYKSGKILDLEKDLTPVIGAVFYNKVRDDIVKVDNDDESLAFSDKRKSLRLDGRMIVENEDLFTEAEMQDRNIREKESIFLPVTLNKNGSVSSSSKVLTREEFAKIDKFVRAVIKDTVTDIYKGKISVLPISSTNYSGCDYCDYAEVCGFDSKNGRYRRCVTKADEAWAIISRREGGEDVSN